MALKHQKSNDIKQKIINTLHIFKLDFSVERYTIKPVLRGYLWNKEKVVLYKRLNSYENFYHKTRKK
jgi:hypothetical protein